MQQLLLKRPFQNDLVLQVDSQDLVHRLKQVYSPYLCDEPENKLHNHPDIIINNNEIKLLAVDQRYEKSTCNKDARLFYIESVIDKKTTFRKELLRSTKCIGCSALQKCQQGCIGRAARNGDEMGLDDQCDYRRALQFKNLFLFSNSSSE